MADDTKSGGDSFDLERLKQLVRLMEKHDLTEVKLEGVDQKWVLRRGPQGTGAFPPQAYHMPGPPLMMPAVAAPHVATGNGGGGEATVAADNLLAIKSPTVGTFYQSPEPGDPPFVKPGDSVRPDTTVCIVEAMKVFNQIPAEVTGTIVEVLVENGEPVEFGQPLFKVKPA